MAGIIRKEDTGVSLPEIVITNKSAITRTKRAGTVVRELAVATFDTAGTDSAGAANTTIAAHGLGVYLPAKAIITNAWYDVVSTFTSATDAATVAFKVQSANDILSAIAISDASNVLDAGIHGTVIGYPNFGADAAHDSAVEVAALFASSMLKLTASRELTATVAVEALTGGKANLFVEYVISD
jgi:hypothetical protein